MLRLEEANKHKPLHLLKPPWQNLHIIQTLQSNSYVVTAAKSSLVIPMANSVTTVVKLVSSQLNTPSHSPVSLFVHFNFAIQHFEQLVYKLYN